MGLDSYLYAKKYMSTFKRDENAPDSPEVIQAKQILELYPELANVNPDKDCHAGVEVQINVGYWRKANHIHQWFVDNVQGGEDNCQTSYVDEEALALLLDTCKEVMADNSKAADLLPTASGCFFGNTEYGEGYFDDVKYTITMIENLLKVKDRGDVYYQASW